MQCYIKGSYVLYFLFDLSHVISVASLSLFLKNDFFVLFDLSHMISVVSLLLRNDYFGLFDLSHMISVASVFCGPLSE